MPKLGLTDFTRFSSSGSGVITGSIRFGTGTGSSWSVLFVGSGIIGRDVLDGCGMISGEGSVAGVTGVASAVGVGSSVSTGSGAGSSLPVSH